VKDNSGNTSSASLQAQGLFLLHNFPNHPGLQTHVLFWQVPFLHPLMHVDRCCERLPISQWLPLNPIGHLQMLFPLHLPPFKQGMTHLAKKYERSLCVLNCLNLTYMRCNVQNIVYTHRIHSGSRNNPLNTSKRLSVRIFHRSNIYSRRYLKLFDLITRITHLTYNFSHLLQKNAVYQRAGSTTSQHVSGYKCI